MSLTDEQVQQIELLRDDQCTVRVLVETLGLSMEDIADLVLDRRLSPWKHHELLAAPVLQGVITARRVERAYQSLQDAITAQTTTLEALRVAIVALAGSQQPATPAQGPVQSSQPRPNPPPPPATRKRP